MVLAHYVIFYHQDLKAIEDSATTEMVGTVVQVDNSPAGQTWLVDVAAIAEKPLPWWRSSLAKLYSQTHRHNANVGDTVTVTAKLRHFRSRINIGLFNPELHAFRKRVLFKGSITSVTRVLNTRSWRQDYRVEVAHIMASFRYGWLYYLLLTGDTALVDYQDKQQFRELGLSHLLAISGLHIGIVFMLAFSIIKLVSYCVQPVLSQRVNLHQFCLLFALLLSAAYVVVCGYSVSATRALFMAACGVVIYTFALPMSSLKVLLYALTAVLFFNPFAVLNPGLYYSFIAVAVLLATVTMWQHGGKKWGLLLLCQAMLFVLLMPLNLFYFAGFSVISLFANLLVIPLVSVLLFPALLLQLILGFYLQLHWPLSWLDQGLAWLLTGLAEFPYPWLESRGIDGQLVALCYLSLLLLWLFRHYFALLPLSCYMIFTLVRPQPSWEVDFFDVGHGTAVLISQQQNGILYDIGAKYFGFYSMFEFVIKPYLVRNNIALHHTIISHDDGDHNGGITELKAYDKGNSLAYFHGHEPQPTLCQQTQLHFGTLHLSSFRAQQSNNDNNNSCVLRVSDGTFTVLLPGDIEAAAEQDLVARQQHKLAADILLAPHHGSKSSSTAAFIDAVSPTQVIFSSAFHSPWEIPAKEVLQRYRQRQIKIHDTAQHGHIRVAIYNDKVVVERARNKENHWFLR